MASQAQHIVQLGIERLWRTTRGRGIRVAVLDTGVLTSAALPAARVSSLDIDGAPSPSVSDLHGTFCASLIASEKQHLEGVAPEAQILSIRTSLASGGTTAARAVKGLRLALDQGCDVINCSFVLQRLASHRSELLSLVREAHLAGVVVVAAAGNTPGANAEFPQLVQNAIVVGAHNRQGRALRVDHNEFTDVCCLGERLPVANGSGLKRRFDAKTSGATALVSGVVALGLASVSAAKRRQLGVAMEGLLKATAQPMAGAAVLSKVDPSALLAAIARLV